MSAKAAAIRRRRRADPFRAALLAPRILAPALCRRAQPKRCDHSLVLHKGRGPCLVVTCPCTMFVDEEV